MTVVCYTMRKVNMVLLIYNFTSTHMYMWCQAVFHVENPISSYGKINLHLMRHGILPRGMVYTVQDLAMKASYTIHENDY